MSAQPEELPVIEFVSPMPGFPDLLRFVLLRLDDDGLLYALTSVEEPKLRFLVMPPTTFFPDYAPEVPQDAVDALDIASPDDVLLLLVVTPGEKPGDATANLMAPILVEQRTRRALQVVLAGSGLPVRAELMAPKD
ncbi:MAG TPA: flagellar assembly protein FliW [Pilimelia sp.]|nr:flagellar assembly protein FliW [Pilimelia sp.]